MEKTRTLKCHQAILIYGGREIGREQTSTPCDRKPRNFCSNFHRRVSRKRLAIKKMFLATLSALTGTDTREEGNEEKLRKRREEIYFREVELFSIG